MTVDPFRALAEAHATPRSPMSQPSTITTASGDILGLSVSSSEQLARASNDILQRPLIRTGHPKADDRTRYPSLPRR